MSAKGGDEAEGPGLNCTEAVQSSAGGNRKCRRKSGHALGEFSGANVTRGRAHPNLRGNGGLIELNGERNIDWIGRLLEVSLGLLVHALHLAVFHAEDAQRLPQLVQVAGIRGQDDDLAAWGEHALEFGRIAWGEDDGNSVDGLITNGQALPYIGHDGTDARVALSQVLRSVRRNIESDAAGLSDGVEVWAK